MTEIGYRAQDVTAVEVTVFRDYGDGEAPTWWVRDVLERGTGGGCAIDAPTAWEAAEVAARWAGAVLSGSYSVAGDRVTYRLARAR